MAFMKRPKKEEEPIPPLPFCGEGKKSILFVANTIKDDIYLLGKDLNTRFLRKTLMQLDLDIDEDAWYTNLITPGIKTLKQKRKALDILIQTLNPKSIVLLGEEPYEALLYPRMVGRLNGTAWSAFIGYKIPDQELKMWVSVINAPEELLETVRYKDGGTSKPLYERDPSVYMTWKNCLINVFKDEQFPVVIDKIEITESEDRAIEILNQMSLTDIASFDFETTGIKPHRKGHKIVYMSVADNNCSYAFPFFESEKFKEAFKNFILSNVKKISHNLQYESIWTHHFFDIWPNNWYWDTMIVQHCLANTKPANLKFCTYTQLGVLGYDDNIDQYIKSSEEDESIYGGNAFNRIMEAPVQEALTYNALDSWYTYLLYLKQKAYIDSSDYNFMAGIEFTKETHITFAKMSERGVCVDEEYLRNVGASLTSKMQELSDKIMASEEVQKWNGEEPFNFNSGSQLGKLLFDILGIKPIAMTEKNAPSVDKINLPKYDLPFIKAILEYRKLSKIYDTYIKQMLREVVDGKIHSSFSMTNVKTFRSSSYGSNLQQSPKRDPEAKTYIRKALKPSPGNRIVEYDHAQLEVRIAACHNKDPNLIKYIMDPTTDMHRDSAMDGYILKKEEVTKNIRQSIKSDFVFAEFYGSYYPAIAYSMWERSKELDLREHLRLKGIHNYKQFENHIRKMEEKFWDVRFPVYKKYRQDIYEFYKRHGYVEQKTGFRCFSPMKRNNAFNSPGQGDAAHVLLWGMNKVDQALERRGMKSKVIVEIHDSLVIDLDPSEEKVVDYLVWLYCTQKVVKYWDWINIPLMMEKEITAIDGNWAETEGCGYIGENE